MSEITSRPMAIHGAITATLCTLVLLLSGCSLAASKNQPMAAGLSGYNHTLGSITSFSVNGSRVSVGGVQCCVLLPAKWTPGLHARVKWESLDKSKLSPMPKFSQVEAYKRWEAELDQYSTQHEVSVPIPEYDADTACSMKVHFLPCNQVKVTTSCQSYGSVGYPINEPMDMKEPAVCPK
ncbi:DUF3304 domain-containing protein [Providencia rettgeri]|nr:DUF3304 domain-containing protein [Providencia rettgeri]ELR5189071.1 DUF3304 domain-containing protein [Providencia rettgeri]EMB0751518.1 DUF3304 domain-containing protein [Providencia rettgeri]HEC8345554.1 DUF3304 domain-containing protein [Providencia rettgeri]